jgi:hypothetical protein
VLAGLAAVVAACPTLFPDPTAVRRKSCRVLLCSGFDDRWIDREMKLSRHKVTFSNLSETPECQRAGAAIKVAGPDCRNGPTPACRQKTPVYDDGERIAVPDSAYQMAVFLGRLTRLTVAQDKPPAAAAASQPAGPATRPASRPASAAATQPARAKQPTFDPGGLTGPVFVMQPRTGRVVAGQTLKDGMAVDIRVMVGDLCADPRIGN